jgi:hypothetical protein
MLLVYIGWVRTVFEWLEVVTLCCTVVPRSGSRTSRPQLGLPVISSSETEEASERR